MAELLGDPAFWALVALILFFVVVIYMKVPGQLGRALDRRAEAISKELDEARRLREEAEALLAEYQKKAREATDEAAEIIEQARREAAAMAAEAAQRSEDYVARRTRIAEQKIQQAETQALAEVRALSADLAIAASERILGDKVKGDAARSLIERAIGDVRTRLN
jgi:F-type H+-transporting ATPase subunit b